MDLTNKARALRKKSTDAERKLWFLIRNSQLGARFRRQHPFPPYIVDFYCPDHQIVIEIDGSQHTPEIDKKRTLFLEQKGLKIIRFWNNEVLNSPHSVLEKILTIIPHPNPLRKGEEILSDRRSLS